MGLAENLLNSLDTDVLNESDYSTNEEEHIVIDASRRIIIPNSLKDIAVMGDKDVETVTFDCIRFWDEHDLSTFDIYINYILPNGDTGTYIPTSITTHDDYFSFQWTIGFGITQHKGTLNFSITATKTHEDGTLLYQWSSLLNNECRISQGLEISDVIDPLQDAFETGRKAEYDAFWESYMPDQYLDYDSHFAGRGWNDATFKPPYDIPRGDREPTSFSRMFANCDITDLSQCKINWAKATRTDQMFYWANRITALPEIDVSNLENCFAMFSSATNLVTIEKFKVSAKTVLTEAFYDCPALENLIIEGTISQNNFNTQWSTKLSKASIVSIIWALDEKVTGKSITLSKTAVDTAFYDSNKDHDGSDSAEWEELISERDNWTINLV